MALIKNKTGCDNVEGGICRVKFEGYSRWSRAHVEWGEVCVVGLL